MSSRRRAAACGALAAAVLALATLSAATATATATATAAAADSPPPFTTTGPRLDLGDGVRTQAGVVTVTDPTDGPVAIDTTLYLPRTTPAPAVLLSHGFGGSKDSAAGQALQLARSGLVVLTWSAPGFGASGGTISLMSLDHEIPDARQLIDHLAGLPAVRLDGPGDPRIGVAGGSYGGAASLLIAGTDPRVDAVGAAITWNDLAQALFPDESLRTAARTPAPPAPAVLAGDGPLKAGWAASLFASGLAPAPRGGRSTSTAPRTGVSRRSAPAACGRFRLDYCLGYTRAVATGRLPATLRTLLTRSSPATVLARVRAPTLLIQGEQDTLFGLDQAEANARGLIAAGAPVTVHWYVGGHDAGALGEADVGQLTDDFLRTRLTTTTATGTNATATGAASTRDRAGFSYQLTGRTDPTTGDVATSTVVTDGYPVALGPTAAGARFRTLPLAGAAQQVIRPPGGRPAAVTAVTGLAAAAATRSATSGSSGSGSGSAGSGRSPGSGQAGGSSDTRAGAAGGALGPAVASPPGQTAGFLTAPLADRLTVTGQAQVELAVTAAGPGAADGPLFARLVDVAPDGSARLLGPGAAPFTVPAPGLADGRTAQVRVTLPGAVVSVDPGHRLGVSIATTDAAFAVPAQPAAYTIGLPAGGAALRLPSVPARGGLDPAAVGTAIPRFPLIGGLVVLALLAAGALVLLGRRLRGRNDHQPPGHAAAGHRPLTTPDPLVVTGLVKSYPDGFRAVDGIDFRARRGEVLGLLGPNGAGKTTTLRMLMGLLRPTDGTIAVFGRPVTPGAPVLSRVGAFVEGPGLLPHLTGRGNLRSFWAATGRPESEASFEQVLAIADLGSAVDRRTRTYSQGMRQRLAIAQAMLGTPDLLVLDEPTNGLDPPQIAAMRAVVRRYAAAGRTVVLSSHLLAEVEQTCDHVVVMARGRVLADAPTAELVGASGPTVFDVDDPAAAALVLAGLPGVTVLPDDTAIPDDPVIPDGAGMSNGARDLDGGGVLDGAAVPATSWGAGTVSALLGEVDRTAAVAALVRAGVGVRGVRARNRLEDAFLRLVAPTGPDLPMASTVGAVSAGEPG